jgi:hypothetical protein
MVMDLAIVGDWELGIGKMARFAKIIIEKMAHTSPCRQQPATRAQGGTTSSVINAGCTKQSTSKHLKAPRGTESIDRNDHQIMLLQANHPMH